MTAPAIAIETTRTRATKKTVAVLRRSASSSAEDSRRPCLDDLGGRVSGPVDSSLLLVSIGFDQVAKAGDDVFVVDQAGGRRRGRRRVFRYDPVALAVMYEEIVVGCHDSPVDKL